jgi:hypothetical protein
MSIDISDHILSKVQDSREKQRRNWRNPIRAEERLVVAIR